nr:MAG TPA: hypothetical protein [Caudoviricetes sp.]
MKGLIMFNRASGIPLLIASVGCIAYQMIQEYTEPPKEWPNTKNESYNEN